MPWILKIVLISIAVLIFAVFLLVLLYMCNRIIRHFIYGQTQFFSSTSKVRNVSTLLIGEIPSFKHLERINPDFKEGIRLFLPGASICSCYEVLRHTHSILNETGSTVILAYSKKKNGFTVFDIPFFHDVTISRLGLGKLKKKTRFPLLYYPLSSIRLLMHLYRGNHNHVECKNEEIQKFCEERNIHLILLEV